MRKAIIFKIHYYYYYFDYYYHLNNLEFVVAAINMFNIVALDKMSSYIFYIENSIL